MRLRCLGSLEFSHEYNLRYQRAIKYSIYNTRNIQQKFPIENDTNKPGEFSSSDLALSLLSIEAKNKTMPSIQNCEVIQRRDWVVSSGYMFRRG